MLVNAWPVICSQASPESLKRRWDVKRKLKCFFKDSFGAAVTDSAAVVSCFSTLPGSPGSPASPPQAPLPGSCAFPGNFSPTGRCAPATPLNAFDDAILHHLTSARMTRRVSSKGYPAPSRLHVSHRVCCQLTYLLSSMASCNHWLYRWRRVVLYLTQHSQSGGGVERAEISGLFSNTVIRSRATYL